MKAYGSVNLSTGKIKINKSMNKNGIEFMDTGIHERLHLAHPKASERDIINKSKKVRLSTLAII